MMQVSLSGLSTLLLVISACALTLTCNGQRIIPLPVKPFAMAIDAAGDIFISDFSSNILQFSNNGTLQKTFNNISDTWDVPSSMAVTSDGTMVFYTDGFHVISLDTRNGYVSEFNISSLNLQPNAVAVDPSGYVYVAYNANKKIVKYSQTGISQHVFDLADDPSSNNTNNNTFLVIAFDAKGNLYWADTTSKVNIIAYPLYTDVGSISWSVPNFLATTDIAVDASGNIYAACLLNDFIVNVSSNGTVVQQITYPSLHAEAIAVDSQGNVYVADNPNSRLVVFGPTEHTSSSSSSSSSSTGVPTFMSSSSEYRYSSTGNSAAVTSYLMRFELLALFLVLTIAATTLLL